MGKKRLTAYKKCGMYYSCARPQEQYILIRAVLLAAANGGNRKTWRILLPDFRFGGNIYGTDRKSVV